MMKRSIVRTGRWAALCSVVALSSLACQKKDSPSSQPSTQSMPHGGKTTPTEPPHNPKVTPKIRKTPKTPLEEFYPVGRVTNTVILSNAAGKASNTKWAIKGTAFFDFDTDVEFKDTVVSNAGGRLVLDRTFTKVRQALFVTKKSLVFSLPKGPVIDFVTNKLVGLAPPLNTLLGIVRELDPRGEKTLGAAVALAKRLGYDIDSLGLADFNMKFFDQLDGVTFRITYANGGKLIQVERADGETIAPATLHWLERTHGILMDQKVFPDRSASIGKAWSVKAADLGMMLLEPEVPWNIQGKVSVSRAAPCSGFPPAGPASRYAGLEVEESRVTFVKDTDESRTTAWIIPAGCLVFDLNGPFVTYGNLGFTAGYESLSKGHLLFGSTFTTTVRGSLYYQHEVMPGR